MMHETKMLVPHFSNIVFNIISSSKNLVIFRLSWLTLHNPQMDQHTFFFSFQSMKGDAFLAYAFLPHDLRIQHEIPF